MIYTAHSTNRDVKSAVAEMKDRLGDDARLVLFFASPAFEPTALAAQMQDAFPGTATLGCTTAGELTSGRMLDKSLVAMSIGSDEIGPLHIETVGGLRASAEDGIKEVLRAFETKLGIRTTEMERERWAGFVLTDGLSVAEERVMETLSDATNAAFVGARPVTIWRSGPLTSMPTARPSPPPLSSFVGDPWPRDVLFAGRRAPGRQLASAG